MNHTPCFNAAAACPTPRLGQAKWLGLLAALVLGTASAAPVLITSAANASLAGASTLDFNAEAQGTFGSRSFGANVTISAPSGNLYIENTYGGSYASSGNYLANHTNSAAITITFNSAVTAFGMNWGAADQGWTLEVFNTLNALIGTLNIAAQDGGSDYAGFIGADGAGAAIGSARLTAHSSYGYDYVLIDDLRFVAANANANPNAVPEPQSLALVALALIGLGAARRRKAA